MPGKEIELQAKDVKIEGGNMTASQHKNAKKHWGQVKTAVKVGTFAKAQQHKKKIAAAVTLKIIIIVVIVIIITGSVAAAAYAHKKGYFKKEPKLNAEAYPLRVHLFRVVTPLAVLVLAKLAPFYLQLLRY